MEAFGIGHLYVQPPYPTTTPYDMVEAAVLQDVSWDFKFDTKELHGAYQFPVSVRRGKGTIDGTAKVARLRPELFAGVFGVDFSGLTAGGKRVVETTATVATGAATLTIPGTGTLSRMIGVWYTDTAGNAQMKQVTGTPSVGQYKVTAATQTLTFAFNSSDNSKKLRVVYEYDMPTADDAYTYKVPLTNQEMGITPICGGGIFVLTDNTRQFVLELNRVLIGGLKFAAKIDDWTYADLPLKAFPDCANAIGYLSMSSVEAC